MVIRNILKSSSSTGKRKSLCLVCSSGSYRRDSGGAVLYFLFKINLAECFLKTTLSAGCGIAVEKRNDFVSLLLFFSAALCRILSPIWLDLHDVNNELFAKQADFICTLNASYCQTETFHIFFLALPLSISELAVLVWGCPVLFSLICGSLTGF